LHFSQPPLSQQIPGITALAAERTALEISPEWRRAGGPRGTLVVP
jgi:hypothetical protein